MALLWKFISFLYLINCTLAVDKNNFKTCEQSSFCRRLRQITPGKYELDFSTLKVLENEVELKLLNTEAQIPFKVSLTAISGNIFRLQVDEIDGLYPRYRPQLALSGEPQVSKLQLVDKTDSSVTVSFEDNKAVIYAKPFRIEFYKKDILVSVVNARGLFEFEHYRQKPVANENGEEQSTNEDPGAWEENFKSHHDSKPRGPSAVAVDITFPSAHRVYGLPEHAERLSLRNTKSAGLDPYRMYNLDVFEYEIDSPMSLYGAINVIHAHSIDAGTVGVYWNNAAETWIDVENKAQKGENVVSSIVKMVSGGGTHEEHGVDIHFMSESGIADLFVLMGPSLKDTTKQYASLTGVAPLPQYFALAYHQSRWNYNDEDDVVNVVAGFDAVDMPLDVMWLDIEYTDGKKYFTWDPKKFAHPEDMMTNLTSTGRKLVVIIDPHIKREAGYFLHEDALNNDLYVKTKDGSVYEGWCWPGSSSYLDYYDPKVVEYFKGLYSIDKFKGTNHEVYIWNDMNEPSVFNGPEVTMPKDCLHYGGWEHRDVHNEYGLAYTYVTYKGLRDRSPNRRPFILTRSFFAGSQRYVAMWTGDNAAEWSHLAISFPMCLTQAISGMGFCGADVGGFFGNPDLELLQRWYQAGIWLPFFRAHAHIDTRRREPYLYDTDVRNRIRRALRLRYAHLPLWYTVFFEHETTGEPVIRPLFYQYPNDQNVLDVDNVVLVGTSVLARAISEPGVSTVGVYLPGGESEYWYDMESFKLYHGTGNVNIPVSLDKNVAFYRGGSIIPRKDRPRRASNLMRNDPFTLYIALDSKKSAAGTLYIDDNESYDYKNKKYVYISFKFEGNTLTGSLIDKTDYPTKEWLERVIILGPPKGIKSAQLTCNTLGTVTLETWYTGEDQALIIRKPAVNIKEPFTIKLI